MLEQYSFPRHRPGETLHPGVETLFQQLGVADAIANAHFIRHRGHWVQWNRGRLFQAFGHDASGDWRGFQIPRPILDKLLLERASALGVVALQPCRAREVILHNHRVVGVHCDVGNLLSRHLIDASGGHAWLSRQLGLARQAFSPPLIARYGYAQGVRPGGLDEPELVADRDGWYWTARLGHDLHHWTRLCFPQTSVLRMVPPPWFELLQASGPIRGADVTWRLCSEPAGEGYVVVGDAASVLDPAASHGVLKALMSGIMAAHAVLEEASRPLNQEDIWMQYRQWMQDGFRRDLVNMHELYRVHPFARKCLPSSHHRRHAFGYFPYAM